VEIRSRQLHHQAELVDLAVKEHAPGVLAPEAPGARCDIDRVPEFMGPQHDQLAKLSGGDDAFDFAHQGAGELFIADLADRARRVAGAAYRMGVFQRRRQRFLHEHMTASLQRRDRHGGVEGHGRGDHRDVGRQSIQHGRVIGKDGHVRDLVVRQGRAGAVGIEIAHADQGHVAARRDGLRVFAALSHAGDRCPEPVVCRHDASVLGSKSNGAPYG
jgi:hypothetical protein